MGKGKGRRRRQANYLASHGGDATQLPALRARDDVGAATLPSKLRRIIALKESATPRQQNSTIGPSETSINEEVTKPLKQKTRMGSEKSEGSTSQQLLGSLSKSLEDADSGIPSRKKKRRRGENLNELMEKFKVTPACAGLNARKKKFLEEKKKRRKKQNLGSVVSADSIRPLHQQEEIGFGDVVDAPPRLSLMKKKVDNYMSLAKERVRQRTVETYRQKKSWQARPGSHQPPPLTNLGTTHF